MATSDIVILYVALFVVIWAHFSQTQMKQLLPGAQPQGWTYNFFLIVYLYLCIDIYYVNVTGQPNCVLLQGGQMSESGSDVVLFIVNSNIILFATVNHSFLN